MDALHLSRSRLLSGFIHFIAIEQPPPPPPLLLLFPRPLARAPSSSTLRTRSLCQPQAKRGYEKFFRCATRACTRASCLLLDGENDTNRRLENFANSDPLWCHDHKSWSVIRTFESYVVAQVSYEIALLHSFWTFSLPAKQQVSVSPIDFIDRDTKGGFDFRREHAPSSCGLNRIESVSAFSFLFAVSLYRPCRGKFLPIGLIGTVRPTDISFSINPD